MTESYRLEETVDQLEDNTELYQQSVNQEARVSELEETLERFNEDLEDIRDSVSKLHHLANVLRSIVNEDVPDSIQDAKNSLNELPDPDESEILNKLIEPQDGEYSKQIDRTQESIQESIEDIERNLEDFQKAWENRLSAARQVQQLLGEAKNFEELSDQIMSFIKDDMSDKSNSIHELKSEWNELKNGWESFQTATSFDELREDYGLSKESIGVLETLSSGEEVALPNASPETIEEIKQIESLESNLYLALHADK